MGFDDVSRFSELSFADFAGLSAELVGSKVVVFDGSFTDSEFFLVSPLGSLLVFDESKTVFSWTDFGDSLASI